MRTWPSLSARSHMFQYFPSSAYSPPPSRFLIQSFFFHRLVFASQQGRDFPATHLSFWASFPIFDCFDNNNNNWRLAKEVENKLGGCWSGGGYTCVVVNWSSTLWMLLYVTGRVGGTRLDGQPTARQIPHLYFSFFFYGRAGRSIRFTEEAWPNPQARSSSHTHTARNLTLQKIRRRNWL